ncbi:MAG: hypothetical protein COA94_07285, partial [Rickettsiales bacterium]
MVYKKVSVFKFTKIQLDVKLIKASLVFALLYCILFNSAVFVYKFEFYQANLFTASLELTKDFIYLTVTLFMFFFGLSTHRILFIVGSILLFVTGAIASYYLFFFSISPTPSMMPAVFCNPAADASELISTSLIVWISFCLAICLYGIYYFKIQTSKSFITRFLSFLCILFVVSNILLPKFSFLKTYFPVQYLHNSYIFLQGQLNEPLREDINTKFSFVDKSDDDVTGVLVIGETARYDKFGINGYGRDTTPNLSELDLVSLKARACATSTYYSVPCMLSRYTEKDIDLVETESSFLSVLTRLGINTTWLGTQTCTKYYKNTQNYSFYDEVNLRVIPGGSLIFKANCHDGKMLPYIKKNIESHNKNFLVLHTTGSHWNYARRYSEEFEKFTPSISKKTKDPFSCDLEKLKNSYDNSMLYTDFFLSRVIEMLK